MISITFEFGVGHFILDHASIKHIEQLLQKMHERAQTENDATMIWQQLIDYVQYHSKARQLSSSMMLLFPFSLNFTIKFASEL